MNKIYVYLKNASETIKLTRDECNNVSIECLNKGAKFYAWIGFSDYDLVETIKYYVNNGYTIRSIFS